MATPLPKPKPTLGIRGKLILIFVLIKVLPLLVLAWFAWQQVVVLKDTVERRTQETAAATRNVVAQVGELATENSIRALDAHSREAIERLTTDTARTVADFLYERDNDILLAAALEPDADTYRRFLATRMRNVTLHQPWILDAEGRSWRPMNQAPEPGPTVEAANPDNARDFHSRPPEDQGIQELRPLYLEMTFVDPAGREMVKVDTTPLMSPVPTDVSEPANTWCRAETYFDELKDLGPGEISVSEVIGPYVGSPLIGPFTPARAEVAGVEFAPERAAYAGKENPVGRRFQGIVRWAAPVYRQGELRGYVTLALDHTHIMEFTDHVLPTGERYSPISDASSGNYAFMWDYQNRCISHPRDYFITGYDPATGEPQIPWMDQRIYELFQQSGRSWAEFSLSAPRFLDPSLERSPAFELSRQGLLGLDCRFLNFAPQCTGWNNMTQHGGSGSFVIFWSGLWKLTTAASIPYHTGRYAGPRGFGYVTVGANVNEFHQPAVQTGQEITEVALSFERQLDQRTDETLASLQERFKDAALNLSLSTAVMVGLVIAVAVWIASTLTRRITSMINTITRFQQGEMDARLAVKSGDEMGQLAHAFNTMSDSVVGAMRDLGKAETKYRAIFESSVEGIFQSTFDGVFISANPAMARIFGYDSPMELIRNVKNIGNDLYVSPGRRDELAGRLRRHGSVHKFEVRLRRKDGSEFWGEISCRAVSNPDGPDYFEGMVFDVTEAIEAREALQKAKDKAEAANRMKSDFLSTVSHELRTPLTSVLGFAKVIRRKLADTLVPGLATSDPKTAKAAEQVARNLDVIVSEGKRLTLLINDVLDLTKLEAGRMDWRVEAVDISEILDRALAGAEMLATGKPVQLRKDLPPNLPQVSADPDRLMQVIINLVSNAIKFTEQGSITIRARMQGEEMVISVIDTGQGIPVEHQESIFERFHQIGDVLTDKPRGTGLGLAICKEIVTRLGGRIWAESTPGKGATFSFTLLKAKT